MPSGQTASLHCSCCYAGAEVTLRVVEYCEHRDAHHQHCCHQQVPLGRVLLVEDGTPQLQRLHRVTADEDERPEEIVPCRLEGEHLDDGHGGNGQRCIDASEDPHL